MSVVSAANRYVISTDVG